MLGAYAGSCFARKRRDLKMLPSRLTKQKVSERVSMSPMNCFYVVALVESTAFVCLSESSFLIRNQVVSGERMYWASGAQCILAIYSFADARITWAPGAQYFRAPVAYYIILPMR